MMVFRHVHASMDGWFWWVELVAVSGGEHRGGLRRRRRQEELCERMTPAPATTCEGRRRGWRWLRGVAGTASAWIRVRQSVCVWQNESVRYLELRFSLTKVSVVCTWCDCVPGYGYTTLHYTALHYNRQPSTGCMRRIAPPSHYDKTHGMIEGFNWTPGHQDDKTPNLFSILPPRHLIAADVDGQLPVFDQVASKG